MKSAKIKLSEQQNQQQDQLRDQNSAYQNPAYVKLAHVDHKSQRCQSMQEHSGNVACFSSRICELPELKSIVELAGFLHDAGKLGTENQADFKNILARGDEAHQYGLDHSTAGGRIALELLRGNPVSEFISTLIYFHHGLEDCINLENGQMLQERRLKKEIEYSRIKESFFKLYDRELLEKIGEQADQSYRIMLQKIGDFVKNCDSKGKKYGSRYFYLGMYLRVALSLLIDGDWTDTGCFFQDIPIEIEKRFSQEETQRIWKECICNFEQYMENEVRKNPDQGNKLNDVRQEISDSCRAAAESEEKRYRLTVPTAAGKTLSSLRFALYHAEKQKKQRIIYIAPYNSILEQNAEEIRNAVGMPSVVLEHHCNVICEAGEEERYRDLTETWDTPIIVTTAVQILNTLFSDRKSCIRRMHNLCNSIIIFDEVQAFPVKCTELFNLAVNFLTQFGDSTVVLCSATQPTLAPLKENNICECREMSRETEKYAEIFKRAEIIDETERYPGRMKTEDLKEFILEKTEEYRSTLAIVNTTACAFQVFRRLEESCSDEYEIFHLSNNMCPQHKLDTLKEIKLALKKRENKIICVSTQVVEAGVNFSFGCVIRSKAGLDNVIQAAGRCNRHKELGKMGAVYIVQMSDDAEHLEHLREIRDAQAALQKVLHSFDLDEGALDSEAAIKFYYSAYYSQLRELETKYPVEVSGVTMTLTDLLGKNQTGQNQYYRKYERKIHTKLPQAFLTAGHEFEVITDTHKISVVVPYGNEPKRLLEELSQTQTEAEKKKILRKLQRYTVGISENRKNKLGNAIYENEEGLLVLCDGYYDKKAGVVDEPEMGFCEI